MKCLLPVSTFLFCNLNREETISIMHLQSMFFPGQNILQDIYSYVFFHFSEMENSFQKLDRFAISPQIGIVLIGET